MNGSLRISGQPFGAPYCPPQVFLRGLGGAGRAVLEYAPHQGVAHPRDHLLHGVALVRHVACQIRCVFHGPFVHVRDYDARVHEGVLDSGAGHDDVAALVLVYGQRDPALLGSMNRLFYQGAEPGPVPGLVWPPVRLHAGASPPVSPPPAARRSAPSNSAFPYPACLAMARPSTSKSAILVVGRVV